MAFLVKQDQLGKHEYLPETLGILTARGRIEFFNYVHAQLWKNKDAMTIYDEANSFNTENNTKAEVEIVKTA